MCGSKLGIITILAIGWLLSFGVFSASAAGTAAGTEIANQASATYSVGVQTGLEAHSPRELVIVQEVVDLEVTWQDAGPVAVVPGATDAVLTFLLTNTGNGLETFSLLVDPDQTGNDFDPDWQSIYLDDGDGIFELGEDTLYNAGTNDPELNGAVAADASIVIFVLCDIPGDAANGESGDAALQATAASGPATPGTVVAGAGDDDTVLLIGDSGGQASDTGTYIVRQLTVNTEKSVVISHPDYPELDYAIPGSILTYTLTVTVEGDGAIENVVLTDPIPDGTTYQSDTLKLNGGELTDEADTDAGDVGATTAGTVTVQLPTLDDESPAQTVSFSVVVDATD